MRTVIWWIRRDLRLTDNQALASALAYADQVLPVFILDPTLLASPYVGTKRLAFLFGGLRELADELRARDSHLVLREGDPHNALATLITETGADTILAEEDFSPYARRRDARVARHLPLELVAGLTVHPPGTILKDDGAPYTVFTPFSRKWKALMQLSASNVLSSPTRIPTPDAVPGRSVPAEPALPSSGPFQPGEAEAQRRLSAFVDGQQAPIELYAERRNRIDLAGTSQLSPYLRFGMLSARQAVVSALVALDDARDEPARQGSETWLNELIWREFYVHILYHFPHVRGQSFRAKLQEIVWDNDPAAFAAWRKGQTGYPVVDAAMRQLAHSGWMHNRARMIVASFLVKDLLIDWRWGERWFMQHLLDGDPAANNGGWQWTAGTGTDAAPYFRIFNPVLQSQKFDPDGIFIRRWVPELAQVPTKFVHEPWRMPPEVQREGQCVIDEDYPAPIVDHAVMRQRALDVYRSASGGS
jgi:deoxyribodipyrimidine photo-lyase